MKVNNSLPRSPPEDANGLSPKRIGDPHSPPTQGFHGFETDISRPFKFCFKGGEFSKTPAA
jgi:hypothetical protein